ncbi:MAG TPA: hypothetical protein VE981_17875 [Planctomycetota bacterium]|nr:hypothetical protein [Planctomycetota bacterium]
MKPFRLDVPISGATLRHLRSVLQRALAPRILGLRAKKTRMVQG